MLRVVDLTLALEDRYLFNAFSHFFTTPLRNCVLVEFRTHAPFLARLLLCTNLHYPTFLRIILKLSPLIIMGCMHTFAGYVMWLDVARLGMCTQKIGPFMQTSSVGVTHVRSSPASNPKRWTMIFVRCTHAKWKDAAGTALTTPISHTVTSMNAEPGIVVAELPEGSIVRSVASSSSPNGAHSVHQQ